MIIKDSAGVSITSVGGGCWHVSFLFKLPDMNLEAYHCMAGMFFCAPLVICEVENTVVLNDLDACSDGLGVYYWSITLSGKFLAHFKLHEESFDGGRRRPRVGHPLCILPKRVIIDVTLCCL